ncbi:MAG: WYL domain-containing protein, partial [Pseudomonadales bacterium]
GGSHKKSNLQVLCERCHENEHGGQLRGPSKTGSRFSKNLNIIDSAIKESARLKIKYSNTQQVKSTRVIRPIKLVEIPFNHTEGKSLCVEAFCELRKEKRNFAVRKILSVAKIN